MFKLSFFINSGTLFPREGLTNEIAFCSMFALRKGILSFASVIDKFECNSVYTLINFCW